MGTDTVECWKAVEIGIAPPPMRAQRGLYRVAGAFKRTDPYPHGQQASATLRAACSILLASSVYASPKVAQTSAFSKPQTSA